MIENKLKNKNLSARFQSIKIVRMPQFFQEVKKPQQRGS